MRTLITVLWVLWCVSLASAYTVKSAFWKGKCGVGIKKCNVSSDTQSDHHYSVVQQEVNAGKTRVVSVKSTRGSSVVSTSSISGVMSSVESVESTTVAAEVVRRLTEQCIPYVGISWTGNATDVSTKSYEGFRAFYRLFNETVLEDRKRALKVYSWMMRSVNSVTLTPEQAFDVFVKTAYANVYLGRIGCAIKGFERATLIRQGDAGVLEVLRSLYDAVGDKKSYVKTSVREIKVYARSGHKAMAAKVASEVIDRYPSDEWVLNMLSEALMEVDDTGRLSALVLKKALLGGKGGQDK